MQALIPGLTQATVENPIECKIIHETVLVRWTPPGEAWPRARIESIKIAPAIMSRVHKPDQGDLDLLRFFLVRTNDTLTKHGESYDAERLQIIRDRISFIRAALDTFRGLPGSA